MSEMIHAMFGDLLKSLRKQQKLTQQELAIRLGVHRNTIGAWERGNYLPESKTIVLELARILKLDARQTQHLLEASLTAPTHYWSVFYQQFPLFTTRETLLESNMFRKEIIVEKEHPDTKTIRETNRVGWNKAAQHFYGGTALPIYGPLAPTEHDLKLLDPIRGRCILEIGCGSGHSLLYLGKQNAAELWGLDLSETQIGYASTLLQENGYTAQLFASPMEENPGLPEGYFDTVISIYALGWTYDLPRTISLIASYLKPGGSFVFSWEHPVYGCLKSLDGQMVLKRSYSDEKPLTRPSWLGNAPVIHYPRKLSTYLNSLIEAGLIVERVIEGDVNPSLASEENHRPDSWYPLWRAQMMPTTLIVKARKPALSRL